MDRLSIRLKDRLKQLGVGASALTTTQERAQVREQQALDDMQKKLRAHALLLQQAIDRLKRRD